jgi:hypothetical protein
MCFEQLAIKSFFSFPKFVSDMFKERESERCVRHMDHHHPFSIKEEKLHFQERHDDYDRLTKTKKN